MGLHIVLISLCAIIWAWYIYFCYRRFTQQKIIEWWIPNSKLRMFWIWACVLLWIIASILIYQLYTWSVANKNSTKDTIPSITSWDTVNNTIENTWDESSWFFNTWSTTLDTTTEDTWQILLRTSIREKLKHVPVSERRWTSAQ
jgi:hypothetical protein